MTGDGDGNDDDDECYHTIHHNRIQKKKNVISEYDENNGNFDYRPQDASIRPFDDDNTNDENDVHHETKKEL